MKIDTSKWKEFKLSDLFDFYNCKCSNASNLMDGNDIFYIGAKKNDNGVMKRVAYDEALVTKGNCIIFICDGQGSVGYSNYMEKDFIGSTTLTVGYNANLNRNVGLFLVSILDLQRPKYSFGRKYRKNLSDTVVKLPTTKDNLPDYNIMQQYIKSLKYKPVKTNLSKNVDEKLNIENWKEFCMSSLFTISTSKDDYLQNVDKGTTPYVSSSSENNGVTALIDCKPSQKANTMTIARNGSVCSVFYHDKSYCASSDDIRILTPKFEMNKYSALFLKTVFEQEKFRYAYGRKLGSARIKKMIFKLPAKDDGTPDFDYMEQYIKKLPYSDRI